MNIYDDLNKATRQIMGERHEISLKQMFKDRVMKNMYLDFLLAFCNLHFHLDVKNEITQKMLEEFINDWMDGYFYEES